MYEQVALHETIKLTVGPVGPARSHVQPVGGVIVNVLLKRQWCSLIDVELRLSTHHSQRPKNSVDNSEPSLLAEAGQGFSLSDALELPKGRKQVFHGGGAETGEDDNAKDEEIAIVVTSTVLAGQRVEVAKVEEFGRVNPCSGDPAVGEEEEG